MVKGLDGSWRVQLDADEASIDFVRIMLFTDFSKLVDQKELSALPLPVGSGAPVKPQTVTMAAPPVSGAKPIGPPSTDLAPSTPAGLTAAPPATKPTARVRPAGPHMLAAPGPATVAAETPQ